MYELLTIGYGNLKPDQFLEKIREHGITNVIDVRRDTVGRIRSYATGQRMAATLSAGSSVMALRHYIHIPELGRPKDMDLDDYYQQLCGLYIDYPDRQAIDRRFIAFVAGYVWGTGKEGGVPALLCACGKALEDDGSVRCHRAIVAKAIVNYLGSNWRIRHV